MNLSVPDIFLLLSGGVDSCGCLHLYKSLGRSVACLFVDYGQPARRTEEQSAVNVAHHYGVPLTVKRLAGCTEKTAGEILSRNAFLISTALLERPVGTSAVAIGLHAGTPYRDCSAEFITAIRAVASFQSAPTQILVPFADWGKADILEYGAQAGAPLHLTYSCEAQESVPCGGCSSCLDRRAFDARA